MLAILVRLWIALLPLAIFLVWYYTNITHYRQQNLYDEFLLKRNRYMFWALVSCFLIVVALLGYYAFSEPSMPIPQSDNIVSTGGSNVR